MRGCNITVRGSNKYECFWYETWWIWFFKMCKIQLSSQLLSMNTFTIVVRSVDIYKDKDSSIEWGNKILKNAINDVEKIFLKIMIQNLFV